MSSYPIWANIVLYQAIWFCGVLGKERLVLVVFMLLALHLYLAKDRAREVLVIALCGVIGVFVDSALSLAGFYVFSPEPNWFPVPLWLVGIWLGFAATFRHAMAFFIARPVLAVLLAAIGAPLTYLAASRLGAVELPLGHLRSALVLSVLWAVLMGLFAWITQTVAVVQTSALFSLDAKAK